LEGRQEVDKLDVSERTSQSLEEFTEEVRAWMEENVPSDLEYIRNAQKMSYEQFQKYRELMRALGAKGWLWPTESREYGGGGLDAAHSGVIRAELAKRRIGLPPLSDLSVLASTSVRAHATEEQKKRFLTAMFTGNGLTWQCFTEPEAGTDVANQQTNALRYTRDGEYFIVNGQKIFVGSIHPPPDFLFLLTRSDTDAPRHENLSVFMCPAELPGITIQPLDLFTVSTFVAACGITGANMEAIKNSIFFDNVRIHESNLIGAEGDGWRVAQTALMNEHGVRHGAAAEAGDSGGAAETRRESSDDAQALRRSRWIEGGSGNYLMGLFFAQCRDNPNIVRRLKENPKLIDCLVNAYVFAQVERAFTLRNGEGMGGAYGGPQLMLYQKRCGAQFGADMASIFGPIAFTDDPEWTLDDSIFEVGELCSVCQAPSGSPEAMKILISRGLSIGR